MIRMYELEERFNNTGRDGVQYLSDSELKELRKLFILPGVRTQQPECSEQFEAAQRGR